MVGCHNPPVQVTGMVTTPHALNAYRCIFCCKTW